MKTYLALIQLILESGTDRDDRTGTGTRSLFGHQIRVNLSQGFPLLTTKKIHFKSVAHELLWFLRGETNVQSLQKEGVRIWNEWATETGELGPVYGRQWRSWALPSGDQKDQIQEVLNQIRTNPHSRRLLVSAWNPADLPDESLSPQENVRAGKMALAPCHAFFQFYVQPSFPKSRLSCQVYQRSCDVFLGLGFNLASYALLTHMIAQQCDLDIGDLVWTGGDVHIYKNHFEQVQLQLTRRPRHLPRLHLRRHPSSLFEYTCDDFEILDYDPHPLIRGQISV